MAKQATWAETTNEPREAAKMYLAAGDTLKALEIIGKHGWTDMLVILEIVLIFISLWTSPNIKNMKLGFCKKHQSQKSTSTFFLFSSSYH